MQLGQLLLLRRDGRMILARVMAVRGGGRAQVQSGANGAAQGLVKPGEAQAELTAVCADWAAAEQRLARACQRIGPAELDAAWQLLVGRPCGTGELAALTCGQDSPQARDDVLLVAGLQDDAFWLDRGQLLPRTPEQRAQLAEVRAREAQFADLHAQWAAVLARIQQGERAARAAVDAVADAWQEWLAQPSQAPAVQAWLDGRQIAAADQTRAAMAMLAQLGRFDAHDDADLWRMARAMPQGEFAADPPDFPPDAADSPLPWLTIDNDAPHEIDDAIALQPQGDGWLLAVAIAHPACWLPPNCPADRLARQRGATLYHPRQVCPMLPDALGQGAASLAAGQRRPALVFEVAVAADGALGQWQVRESWVTVSRAWRYSQVDEWLKNPAKPDGDAQMARHLWAWTQAREARRIADGAWLLYKPEVDVRAPRHGAVQILDASQSSPARRIVTEAMIAAGCVAAAFGQARQLPLPFRCQPPPSKPALPPGYYTEAADVFAMLRCMQASATTVQPGSHGVMALPAYVQVTSPLRRYSDIAAHRQIAAALRGDRPLNATELAEILGICEPAAAQMRQKQRAADRHFKLLLLASRPRAALAAQVVRPLASGCLAFVPELALEVPLPTRKPAIGQWLTLVVRDVQIDAGKLLVDVRP